MESFNLDVNDVACYFLKKVNSKDKKSIITHLKLQKLVYYAQAYTIGDLGKCLFNDEIQAWQHGPVCPKLYEKYKGNSYRELKLDGCEVNNCTKISYDAQKILDAIWEAYGNLSGTELESMTHNESPWKDAMAKGWNQVISISSLQKYFQKILQPI